MKTVLLTMLFLALRFQPLARAHSETEPVPPIMDMTGCFRVTFRYVEDGVHDKVYEPVYEKSEIISASPLTLQRTLIFDQQTQPHWTESWERLDDGRWQQTVIGPYGDFRYSCAAVFLLNQWTCETSRAAKPRRDQDRSYEYLDRKNTLQINDKRWVNVQTNQKRLADGSLHSVEVGWNSYDRVDASNCNE